MKRNLISVLTVVLCLSLMFVAAMTAMATEPGGENTENSSSQTAENESSSSEEGTSSEETSDETDSSSSDESSSDENSDEESSDELSSEESSEEEGAEDGEPSEEDTSSEETSSKRPIYSNGAGGGSTFIDETGSQIAQGNSSGTVSIPGTSSGTSSSTEISPDDEHYEGEATSFADTIYKVMWIPIVISVLCVAGLVYVNFVWNKQGGAKTAGRATSHKNGSKASGVKRRKTKKW